ncbi:Phosphate regulon transcriptional regulatory protein PhoB [uncultured Gammaproteobacteria bacterium]
MNFPAPLILIVEDEAALVALLSYTLNNEGFRTLAATNGEEGLLIAREQMPDMILLDWMLPLLSGMEVCRQLRRSEQTHAIPIIMLTARGDESDRIRGLDAGADDYQTKPFSPAELVARIRAVLRRTRPTTGDETLCLGGITMDLAGHRVRRGKRDIHLGPTEFRLLRHFMLHPGRVMSREQLLDAVWGHDIYVEIRTVDVHIRRLRKALNESGLNESSLNEAAPNEANEADPIRTVRSAGYAFEPGVSAP